MGYYSHLSLAQDFFGNGPDISFPTPVEVMRWKIQDLETRLNELQEHSLGNSFARISKDQLPWVLPEHMNSVSDVIKAIELAQHSLAVEEAEAKTAYYEVKPDPIVFSPRVVIVPSVAPEKQSNREKVLTHGN